MPGACCHWLLAAGAPQEFYESNKDKPLVLLKWLATQAGSAAPGNVGRVRELMGHPAFSAANPNCCYSLFLGFARSVNFHAADGSGYEFIGDAVLKVGWRGREWMLLVAVHAAWMCACCWFACEGCLLCHPSRVHQ